MSHKNVDARNRFRSRTIGFRMSPEESALLNQRVAVSGMNKQDYLISRSLERPVTVIGGPNVQKALRDSFAGVVSELQNNEVAATDPEFLDTVRFLAEILLALKNDEKSDMTFS